MRIGYLFTGRFSLVPGALLGAYQVGVVRKYEWDNCRMDDRLLETLRDKKSLSPLNGRISQSHLASLRSLSAQGEQAPSFHPSRL